MLSFFARKKNAQPDLSESWSELNRSPSPSPARSSSKPKHSNLSDSSRALNLVSLLTSTPCPWTATVKPEEMVEWLKSECGEVVEEVKRMRSIDAGES